MSKPRQIPFLHGQQRADGTTAWHWKPSPRLRKLGWTNRELGSTPTPRATRSITEQAIAINEQLADWESGAAAITAPPKPKKWTFGDLVAAYRKSHEWADCKQSTRREYDVRLRQLTFWAEDGSLPIRAIDRGAVRDLKDALFDGGASKHKVGSTLRVLRLLMNWAIAYELLDENPTNKVPIPQGASRAMIVTPSQSDHAGAVAADMEYPTIKLGFRIGLWSLQRECDLLALTRLSYRALDNVDPADAALLANRKGDVMGFRLRQEKTGAWIDAPMPPELHAEIEEAFTRSQWLLPDDNDVTRACPEYLFQRRARKVLNAADLAEYQFRDWRRSGMCMYRDLGVGDSLITAISGHAIMGHKTILDTYMPPNTRAACAAVAAVRRALISRTEKEKAQ